MTPRTERRLIDGPIGPIEVALDWPSDGSTDGRTTAPRGVAFIGHPHPLYGGTLDNKVAATLARAFVALGCVSVRPNFRGVGRSAGQHDHGDGETDDFVFLIENAATWLPLPQAPAAPIAPFALAGFSFGTFVAARAAARLTERGQAPRHLVLVGTAAGKWAMPPVPADTLLVHGEYDETIPLADVLNWARPLDTPVVVLPGADHFFHRRLSILKRLVLQYVVAREHTEESRIDAMD